MKNFKKANVQTCLILKATTLPDFCLEVGALKVNAGARARRSFATRHLPGGLERRSEK
jgi:hypothetical protein